MSYFALPNFTQFLSFIFLENRPLLNKYLQMPNSYCQFCQTTGQMYPKFDIAHAHENQTCATCWKSGKVGKLLSEIIEKSKAQNEILSDEFKSQTEKLIRATQLKNILIDDVQEQLLENYAKKEELIERKKRLLSERKQKHVRSEMLESKQMKELKLSDKIESKQSRAKTDDETYPKILDQIRRISFYEKASSQNTN